MSLSRRTRVALGLVMAAAALAGCRGAGFRGTAEEARAKAFTADPGKAAIYVVRPDTVRKLPLALVLDDKSSARTKPCSYVLWQVEPGAHQLLAYGENISQLDLKTDAGRLYFVRQDAAGGLWLPRVALSTIDEASGRKAVEGCERIESSSAKK